MQIHIDSQFLRDETLCLEKIFQTCLIGQQVQICVCNNQFREELHEAEETLLP